MSWTSSIAIYFIIWWLTMFVVLPFGIKSANEAGKAVEQGHDAGAPVLHGMKWKVMVTTALSAVIFALVYYAINNGVLDILSFPTLRELPKP